ncbi:hypothetical protein KKD42_00215 [Patescibacteria group bacterium]|nr:hypothetical protein [Patescibacteria group bacterium]
MSKDLQKKIRTLRLAKRSLEPDEAWVVKTRETLLMQVRNSIAVEPVRAVKTIKHIWEYFMPERLFQVMRGPAMAVSAVLLLVLGGSVASVSAAENSLPGDFLYSMKLATEQVRLAFTSGKEDKLKLKVKFAGRRGDELKRVAAVDSPTKPAKVVQAAEILKRDLNTLKKQLDDVKSESQPQKVVEVAKLVDQTSNELVQSLQDSKSSLTEETIKKVTEAQAAAADTGMKAIEVLVEKHNESENVIPKDEVVQAMQDHSKTVAGVTGKEAVYSSSTVLSEQSNETMQANGSATTSNQGSDLKKAVEQMKTETLEAFAVKEGDLDSVVNGDITSDESATGQGSGVLSGDKSKATSTETTAASSTNGTSGQQPASQTDTSSTTKKMQ